MKKVLFLFVFIFSGQAAISQQFDASLQLRPRLEYRNGFKTLLNEVEDGAAFVSQRSRLHFNYQQEQLEVVLSLQNIRVWGDVPLLSSRDQNALAVFEAYAVYKPFQAFSLKVGRQVLAYDNQRILGEADWAQQGQSHDALVLKWLPSENQHLDLGIALNAATETLVDAPYLLNNYKNMQYAWYHMELKNTGLSFLLLNTGYEYEASPNSWETEYRQTYGAFFNFRSSRWSGNSSLYLQTGTDRDQELQGFYAGANLQYQFHPSWNISLGGEYLSGTDMSPVSDKNSSFTPLFGSNHAFNGYMDYFYVGNHQNSVGLLDLYTRLNHSLGKFDLSLIPHYFRSAAEITDSLGRKTDRYLGTEIDLTANYALSKDISLNAGYSQILASKNLEWLKGGDRTRTQNFIWLSVSFDPELFSVTSSL